MEIWRCTRCGLLMKGVNKVMKHCEKTNHSKVRLILETKL